MTYNDIDGNQYCNPNTDTRKHYRLWRSGCAVQKGAPQSDVVHKDVDACYMWIRIKKVNCEGNGSINVAPRRRNRKYNATGFKVYANLMLHATRSLIPATWKNLNIVKMPMARMMQKRHFGDTNNCNSKETTNLFSNVFIEELSDAKKIICVTLSSDYVSTLCHIVFKWWRSLNVTLFRYSFLLMTHWIKFGFWTQSASFHVTPIREFFAICHIENYGKVYLSNNQACTIDGISTLHWLSMMAKSLYSMTLNMFLHQNESIFFHSNGFTWMYHHF